MDFCLLGLRSECMFKLCDFYFIHITNNTVRCGVQTTISSFFSAVRAILLAR